MLVKQILVALLWACVLVSCAGAQPPQTDAAAVKRLPIWLLRESVPSDARERLAYKAALDRYLDALRESPWHDNVGFYLAPLLQLGQMELVDGNHAEALSHLQKVVSYIHLLNDHPDAAARWPEVQFLEEAELMVAECLRGLQRQDQAAQAYVEVIDHLRKARPAKPVVLAGALHNAAALAAQRRDMALARRAPMRAAGGASLAVFLFFHGSTPPPGGRRSPGGLPRRGPFKSEHRQ